MNRFRTTATAALAAGAIAAGTLAGTALGAGDAAARVDSGRYTWIDGAYGINTKAPVNIHRGKFYVGGRSYDVHQTRGGGYVNIGVSTYTFTKRGNGYVGKVLAGPFVLGGTSLTPRR
ncbi:hypothetical protein K8O93_18735 [Gordonia bronchialis]|uniref:hypothetical protein n=1 Tax=Gordonia bronchialis TaxID=2054 RepID=UPI001CBBE39F|nr:hypothetical protein [Gordonia bronchialis]UAK37183.1 hypothetical protein K8O93_18735 [Gordonia bronchialis]